MAWYKLVYKQKTARNTSRVFFGSAVKYRVAPSQPKETAPSRHILDALLSNGQQGELMYCSTVFSMRRRVAPRTRKESKQSQLEFTSPSTVPESRTKTQRQVPKQDWLKASPYPWVVYFQSEKTTTEQTRIHVSSVTSHELLYEPLVYLNLPTL